MDERDWLTAGVRAAATERTLRAGQALFLQRSRPVGLYEVVSGKLRLVRVDRSGREAVLHSACAGQTIAEASLFSSTYHCDAIASARTIVRLYPKAVVLAEFRRNPKAAEAFMAMLGRQVMDLRTKLEQRNILSARERIVHYLTANAGAAGSTVAVTGTLKDLAGELGLSHEALYRTLAEMASAGEIERGRGTISLVKSKL
ncbi:MAG TPA: Crp/Fnr family transcriptional regulator [Xanthobacteraceae bacterium]